MHSYMNMSLFAPGQPDNAAGQEYCAVYKEDGARDVKCVSEFSDRAAVLCQN